MKSAVLLVPPSLATLPVLLLSVPQEVALRNLDLRHELPLSVSGLDTCQLLRSLTRARFRHSFSFLAPTNLRDADG
ncbi:hypothetical protein E2C01_083125 [Portunus trituberculatus]|uniref:Uncharacterized protein n=1 Tax=Portunus trituberculatus TaxID=210409 RepID=A0A5B7J2L7_PORTR|nr:hypothetical protein [Portunus trituberculatus]